MVTFSVVACLRPFAFASCFKAGFVHTSNGILLFLMSARRFCKTSNEYCYFGGPNFFV